MADSDQNTTPSDPGDRPQPHKEPTSAQDQEPERTSAPESALENVDPRSGGLSEPESRPGRHEMPSSESTGSSEMGSDTAWTGADAATSRFEPPPPPRTIRDDFSPGSRGFFVGIVAASVIAGLLGGVVGAVVHDQVSEDDQVINTLDDSPPNGTAEAPEPGTTEEVARTVLPSTVSIGGRGGAGSGVILSSDGLILTNNHVVTGAGNSLTITFQGGQDAQADVVQTDTTSDLAVIKAQNVTNLRPATLGASGDLRVGQQVVAIGSPLGLSGTVTSGIVSAVRRPVQLGEGEGRSTVIDAIQTDAAINPGNSGGALVNMQGQVVGINTAIATVSGENSSDSGSIGVGFAIPIDQARPIAQQLAAGEQATHSQLGVEVGDASESGAEVRSVMSDSPAEEAGLQAGDVITEVDDRAIDSADALVAAVRSHQPGTRVDVTYERNGDEQTVSATLAESDQGGS